MTRAALEQINPIPPEMLLLPSALNIFTNDPTGGGVCGGQVDCAATKFVEYVAEMEQQGATRTGWAVGRAKQTSDGCDVTPRNAATAALYTYTPWVGAYGIGCGREDVGGASLVPVVFHRYWREYPWGTEESWRQLEKRPGPRLPGLHPFHADTPWRDTELQDPQAVAHVHVLPAPSRHLRRDG